MTNWEWLEALANNSPDELQAWFDSEHVETANATLHGDTAPENEDSRERLEAEIESYSAFDMMDTITLDMVIGWLNRQAAITEEQTRCKWVTASADEIAAWRSKVEKLKELNEYHALQYELAGEDADRLQAQVDRLTAERERYREKFGKCLDYADAIHALMDDEGMA